MARRYWSWMLTTPFLVGSLAAQVEIAALSPPPSLDDSLVPVIRPAEAGAVQPAPRSWSTWARARAGGVGCGPS
ncbi:MAG: hypothetical protein IPL76_13895 [Gemmatimonadetes bacterium]|nr:hypothetical protein [Gemmatimonadota bacterium]